jgi:L-Ala-D/L-Glu epimerase
MTTTTKPPLSVAAAIETWPIAGQFTIARGAKREAAVVIATVTDGRQTGRGECVPYSRYGETVAGVHAAVLGMRHKLSDRASLLQQMPAGAARNALDCALWDYEAKCTGTSAACLAGLTLRPVTMPLLKLKLAGKGDAERLRQVRGACPGTRLIADANESWTPDLLPSLMAVAAETSIELVEQPLPAGDDLALSGRHAVPICADESAHDRADLDALVGRYDAINIKLDKAGGLTEALALATEARRRSLKVLVGCMVSTSLAMAPAMLLAQNADWVDLDGPLLLASDRTPALCYDGALVHAPDAELWG